MERLNEAELVRLARVGDKKAFAVLIGRYEALTKVLVQRTIPDVDTTTRAELVQEACLQAYLSLPQLRDNNRFRSWFYSLVLNVCRSYLRERKNTALSLEALLGGVQFEAQHLADATADPESLILQQENRQLLAQALQLLSPKNLAVVTMFYYAGMSLKEIALSLDISLIAVKSRLNKARRELKERLLTAYPERLPTPRREPLGLPAPTIENRRKTMLKVKIADIIRQNANSVVILVDEAGKQALPLTIGNPEGDAIASCLQTNPTPRPVTFGFMANMLNATGAKLAEVRIEALKEGTFYAVAKLQTGEQMQEIDARPADALALSAYTATPIYVDDAVMQQAGMTVEPSEADQPTQPLISRILAELSQKNPSTPSGVDYRLLPSQPRNLDFSHGLEEWHQSYPNQYQYNLETEKHDGQIIVSMKLKDNQLNAYGGLLQHVKADNYRGKRFCLSGYMKTAEVEGSAYLWVRVDLPRATPVYTSRVKTPLATTNDWQLVETIFEVSQDAVGFTLGASLDGRGQAWVCGLKLAEVAQDTPLSVNQIGTKADQPRNLNFFDGLKYWTFGSDKAYEDGIEPELKWQNKPVAFLRSTVDDPKDFATTAQHFKPVTFAGKRVRLSAMVKAEGVLNWAGLWLRVDGPDERRSTKAFDNMQDRPIKGTLDWQRYEVVLDIAPDSSNVSFGLLLAGKGQVWWSDVKLEIVGQEIMTTGIGRSTPPSNLYFTEGMNGWYLGGSHPNDYEDGIVPDAKLHDLPVAYIKSKVDKPGGFTTTGRSFTPQAYLGKRVRMSAWVKSENVEGWSGLWLRLDGEDQRKTLGFDNMQNRPIKGTTDWQKYELVLDVPKETVMMAFGLILSGKGQVWWSNLKFEVVGQDADTTSSSSTLKSPKLTFNKDSWTFSTVDLAAYQWQPVPDLRRNGFAGAVIEGKAGGEVGLAILAQYTSATEYRNKRVRLSGYLKCEGVEQWGGLTLHTGDGKDRLAVSTMRDNPLKGTQDWQKYSLEIEVSSETLHISYGVILLGAGKIWLDDLQLEAI